MEARGEAVGAAVGAPDLRSLTETDQDVATVYLTTTGDVENAEDLLERRWRALRDDLARQGAPEAALRRIDPVVPGSHRRGGCLAAVASTSELVHAEHAPDAPPRDFGCWDALPVVGMLVRWRQEAPAYVVVLTDRRGADITTVGAAAPAREDTVEGHDERSLHKAAAGGWSQRRYQQRAENAWETNAHDVADAVRRAADRVGAEVIVVAGDVRATELLQRDLPERLVRRVESISGGRSPDGSRDEIDAWTQRWVQTASARSTVALLEKFREELGQHDRAADGIDASIRALAQGRVEILLVHDDWADERRVWFGSEPTAISSRESDLREAGAANIRSGRLADVMVRAAFGTGASVWIVPRAGGPAEGVGAILRW